jgi:hypothetical protein
VLPGLSEFLFQCFRLEHRIVISLEHFRFLLGSLHDILQQTTIVTQVLNTYGS